MKPTSRVRELMTREVTTLRRNDKLGLADDLMTMKRVRHLPVLDDDSDEVVGIVSQRDLFRGALARALGYGEKAQRRMLDMLVVKDVMTNQVISTGPDAPVAEAARTMLEHKIGSLLVLEEGRLVGILTEGDFVALAARDR